MKRPSVFFWLLLPPALLLFVLSFSVAVFLLSLAPAVVSWAAAGVLAVVAAWFVLVRRRGVALTGSESSLLGRQISKEGLL